MKGIKIIIILNKYFLNCIYDGALEATKIWINLENIPPNFRFSNFEFQVEIHLHISHWPMDEMAMGVLIWIFHNGKTQPWHDHIV